MSKSHAGPEDALVVAVGDEIWVDLGPYLAEGDAVHSAIEDAAINVIRIVREHDRGDGALEALFAEYDRLRVEGPNGSASYLLYGAAKVLNTTIR